MAGEGTEGIYFTFWEAEDKQAYQILEDKHKEIRSQIDIIGNAIFVDDGSRTGTSLPFPPLDADDISNLVDAANAWAAINFPSVTIPPIDLSAFGAPSVLPPSDYTVTGSLTITGSDAAFLGVGDDPFVFTPTGVDVQLDSSQLSGFAGFTFFLNDEFHNISVGMDPNGTREMSIAAATVPGHTWISPPSPFPWIPGALLSQLGDTFIVSFTDVELAANGVDPVIILNGDLRVRHK